MTAIIVADEIGAISCLECGEALGDMTDMDDAVRYHSCPVNPEHDPRDRREDLP